MYQQRGFFNRAFGFCLSFLLAAGALYVGVRLIAAVLPWLIAVGGSVLSIGLIVALIRWRRERW